MALLYVETINAVQALSSPDLSDVRSTDLAPEVTSFTLILNKLLGGVSTESYIYTPSHTYKIIQLLGKGERAEVLLAKNENNQLVAIKKMFSKEQLAQNKDKEYLEYLDHIFDANGSSKSARREFAIGMQLNHPHIIKPFELVNTAGSDYLIMEYVDGKTLDQIPTGAYSIQESLVMGLQLIDALKYGFAHHLIHRDLYSSNIMIDHQKQLKLIDLESFEKLDFEDDETHEEYAQGILRTLHGLLQCGSFSGVELAEIYSKLRLSLQQENLREQLTLSINPNSADFFIPFLSHLENILLKISPLVNDRFC
jgi:serine/threonine protein kinase